MVMRTATRTAGDADVDGDEDAGIDATLGDTSEEERL